MIKRKLYVIFALLFVSSELMASREIMSSRLRGSHIVVNEIMMVEMPDYNSADWAVQSSDIFVRLYLAEDREIVHNTNQQYCIHYTIDCVDFGNTHYVYNDSVIVDYSTTFGYTDVSVCKYANYRVANLLITSISGAIPDDVILELGIEVTRYSLSPILPAPSFVNGNYQTETNELLLTWGYVGGADEYDVEWLFVDNPSNALSLAYDFANATRITTSNNHYEVPLTYPRGDILFRVRARGTYVSGDRYYPVYGKWSYTPSTGYIPELVSNAFYFGHVGLEDSLTWQYTAVYAEEGKRKEVITFYDGTLRNRQEVTVNNTDNVAIVSETFYDHVGRQALQSIPAPTPSRGVRYYGTGNSSNGLFNGGFEKADYDCDMTLTHALPFPGTAGSAKYYSANNPFVNNPHWINIAQNPADSGYTYSHTRYLNDGTDRIHSQSVPGEAFKIGSGRETKFFYGNPMQVELDRLFGNEVGDASHYQKVVTVDANGENTVSYYDMKERLIASAIIPSSNENLLPVDNTPVIESLNETHAFDENSRSYTQSIVVATPTNYNFTYHVKTASALCDTCNEVGCIDCRYRVVFSLWNPDQLSYVFIDTLVTTIDIEFQHDTMLQSGSYQLYKSISVIDDTITDAAYGEYAWRQRPCVHFRGADTARCYTPCEEYAMEIWGLLKPDMGNDNYLRTLRECENPPQNPSTECEARRQAMLADMSPGGQYFDYKLTCCPADSVCFCDTIGMDKINTFLNTICPYRLIRDDALTNILGQLNTSYAAEFFWDTLRKYWQPEYAEVMLKYHPEYHLFQAECECESSLEQHIFDSIFFNTNTYDRAKELGLLNPIGLDLNEDYNIAIVPYTGYQPFKDSITDPFFEGIYSCPLKDIEAIRKRISDKLLSYMSWGDEPYYISVWWLLFDPVDIAHGGYVEGCEDIRNMMIDFQKNIVGTWAQEYGCSENDARWLLFRSIYLNLKEEIRQTILPASLLNCCIDIDSIDMCDSTNCCNNPSMQWRQNEWWAKQFDISALKYCDCYLKADTGCSSIPLTPNVDPDCAGGFQIRFICNPVYGLDMDNYGASKDSMLQIAYEDCCADCEAHANGWMEELHDYLLAHCQDCLTDTNKWLYIRQNLIDLCMKSCNESLHNEDFSVHQRIDLAEFESLLAEMCVVDPENYTRIVYPRPTGFISDCDCQNYKNVLHSYGLTFWDDLRDIIDTLRLYENIDSEPRDVEIWNHFCIWQLYDNMLQNIDDTSFLYGMRFPEQFRCEPELSELELCRRQAILAAAAQDTITFYHILDSIVTVHRAMYEPHCLDGIADTLRIACYMQEFLYTLYYYDQADNLIKTVPPKGVHLIQSQATLDSVSLYRHNISRYDTLLPGFIHPQHSMATNYKYNTLNQITSSYHPDHDSVSVTYYDILSRPVLSQNGKQRTEHKYSYTLYDSLGRIVEVGQVVNTSSISQADAADTGVVAAFIASGTRTEITHTYYDKPLLDTASGTNLRNRIAAVAFYPQYPSYFLAYQTATHYSYDIHGNVKRLVQDIPALDSFSRKLTYIDYEYDLVSGNVNKVWFQKGCPEQIMHRYRYDADNRLTHVYTSATTDIKLRPLPQSPQFVTMERLDARYFYLPNGMLSRVELGQKNVQGTDYAYTLQGWLKDINGYKTDDGNLAGSDIGHDGQLNMGTINSGFCRDAFSSMLQYYQGDYSPVSGTNYYNKEYNSATSLFNGNISALSTSFPITEGNLMLKNFRYDKLNRIKSMQTATLNVKTWGALTNMFATTYTYDYNGNFTQLKRHDYTGHWIHRIEYQYIPKNNRLNAVTAVGIASSSYHYDAIGNLTRDTGEGLDISWNAAGKVDTIWKNGNVLSTFRYSATGQRQVKKTGNNTYYYIHDASGNVMCIYRQLDSSLYMEEQPIYGSKRLGEYKRRMQIPSGTLRPEFTGTIGYRQYELTDHLGNVMATILDRRQNYSSGDATYKPYIISTTDYYPFGYPISNRSTNIGGYRYFFNGQEGDNEVFGENSLFAFEYRMHDARLGRFWSVDPLAAKYPWNSTYVFAENRVVEGLDMEGSEYLDANKSRFEFKQGGVHLKVSNFLWINRKRWENAASYPQNWTNNSETNQKDIGISTMVSPIYVLHGATDIPMGSIDNTYGAVDPSYNPTDHKIENPKTKSSNYTLDDKRYANRNVSSASPSTGKWARGILAIDILNVLVEQYISITAFYENRIIEKQKKYIDYVLRDINEAIEHKPEIIPNEYRNIQSITNIMNVILQGENNTDDPMIDKIGMKIFNSISKKNIQQSEE